MTTRARNSHDRAPRRAPDPVRRLAYRIVRQVNAEGGYANLVLGQQLRESRLAGRDAAFCTELVHGTLRWQGTYDAVLARCVKRPLAELDSELLDVLRLGTHQLLRMRVGAHAAVDETVRLTRAELGPKLTGLVNAVLRKVSQRRLDQWVRDVAPARADDPIGYLAVAYAHPRWVVEAFVAALGEAAETELEQLLAADNEPPRVTLVARPGLATVEELTAAVADDVKAEPGRWSPYAVVLGGGDPGTIPAVAQGRAGVQDEGSQLVALALAAAPIEGTDSRWLDLCAGPGGKAASLAAAGADRQVRLTAVEPQPHRAALVRTSLRPSPGQHQVLIADGTVPAWRPGSFDRVLADVPCTGLGALRRRPEARWRRTPEDLAALRPLQQRLLESALTAVRPGGVVGYVTCSPHRDETRGVVSAVLDRMPGVEYVDARPLLPGVPDLGDGPDVQLWPHRHGTDAMYLAVLRRTQP